MKIGWLIINSYLKQNKFIEIYQYLVEAGKKYQIKILMKTNTEVLMSLSSLDFLSNEEKPDFIIFWDKDIYLGKQLEQKGFRLFNNIDAISLCDDKALTYLALSRENIPCPKTIIAPKTYSVIDDFQFIDKIIIELNLPLVIKEVYGSFGNQVFLANNKEEIIKIIKSLNNRPFIFQEYIKESKGETIRVNIVDNTIVASMIFKNNTDFRSNFALGSTVSSYQLTQQEKDLALNTFKTIHLDFAGIDILRSERGPLICEVNSNAQFKATLETTNVNVAIEIIKYINKTIYKA